MTTEGAAGTAFALAPSKSLKFEIKATTERVAVGLVGISGASATAVLRHATEAYLCLLYTSPSPRD